MPKWVHQCVNNYLREGKGKDEAWKRCMGAYANQKKAKVKKSK